MMVKIGSINRWQETGLRLARWLVIGFAIFQLIIALVGTVMFPGYIQQHAVDFTPNDNWTEEQTQAALQALDWPAQTMGWIELGSNMIALGISYSLGFILLKRKSQDGFGLYLALVFFIMGGINGSNLKPVIINIPALYYIFHEILGAIGWQLFFIVFFLFPDGKPVPGWSRWIILAWLGFMVISATPLGNSVVYNSIIGILGPGFVLAAIGSQVYRQWKHSSAIQVQQTKWVVYSLILFFTILIPLGSVTFREPSAATIGRDLIVALIFVSLLILFFLSLLASILIAILRYKLYEIDRIISRTLVYTLLTGLLGLVYFGGVAVLQGILTADGRPPTAGSSPPLSATPPAVVIVATTLAIAALANPLRRRLQDFIDRRFYRQKYDAEKALTEFAAAARSETSLVPLTEEMIRLTRQTLQPEDVSVWLTSDPGNPSSSWENSA